MDFERPTPHSARTRRVYSSSPDVLSTAVERAIQNLPRWTLNNSEGYQLNATRKSAVFRFRDDVTIQLVGRSKGTEAHFESASRVGKSDLGQNVRNLRMLLKALDQELD